LVVGQRTPLAGRNLWEGKGSKKREGNVASRDGTGRPSSEERNL